MRPNRVSDFPLEDMDYFSLPFRLSTRLVFARETRFAGRRLSLFQFSPLIASETVVKGRQMWIILYLCCDLGYKDDAGSFENTQATVGLLIVNNIE